MDCMIKHLKDRHLNPDIYQGLSICSDVSIFPLWNLSGQMVGYQQYRPDGDKKKRRNPALGKYYTRIKKESNKAAITAWGLDMINVNNRRIYLLEGIFKACRFHNLGLNALATISNNPQNLKGWLMSLGYELYSVCDGDVAGGELAKYGDKSLILPEGIYVDDMSNLEFEELIRNIET